jgi:hypothetical protein
MWSWTINLTQPILDLPRNHTLLTPFDDKAFSLTTTINLEDGAIAHNINWRSSCGWAEALGDLSPAFPGRALQYLGERQLVLGEVVFTPKSVCDPISEI